MNDGNFQNPTDLVESIKKGGPEMDSAINVLYRRYRNEVLTKVITTIRFRKGQQEDAADLMHDAFIILIDKIRSVDYEQGSLPNFWTGICNGLFKNKWKRDIRTQLVDDNSRIDQIEDHNPLKELEDKQRVQIFENLLAQLGEKCTEVMKLSFAGFSMKEIAEKMNLVSDGMARKIKYNCKKELKQLIEKLNLDF